MKLGINCFLFLMISLLFLSLLFTLVPRVKAEQTVLNNNFTTENSLNPSIWVMNGPSGTAIFEAVKSSVVAASGWFYLVDPNPSFSSEGMQISSIDGPWKMTTLESVNSYYAPLTLQASVMATQGGGAPFCLWLRNYELPGAVGFNGILNQSAPNFGIWSDHRGQWWAQRMISSPQLDTVYQLTITVNSAGDIALTIASNGQTLHTVSEQSIGTGPFKIVLGQYEIWNEDTGIGPNQAYWKSVTLTSSSPSTNTTTPSSTNTTTTASPTQTSSGPSTTSPEDSSNVTSTPSPNPPVIPPSTSSSNASDGASSKPQTETAFTLPMEAIIAAIAIPILVAVARLFYRSKKREKVTAAAPAIQRSTRSKLFLLGLLAAVFSIEIIDIFVPLLRPEIARSFGVSTATAFQLSAFAAVAGVITGLTMSVFSTRIRYKTLLIAGVLITVASPVGVFLAPSFLFAQIFYALNGVGSVMVGSMVATLVGELYPHDKKAKRISWIMVTGQLATFIGSPITGFLANTGGVTGWRDGLLWFTIPATLSCLTLVFIFVPNRPLPSQLEAKKPPFLSGFRHVFANKSAVACLVSSFLAAALASLNGFAPAFLAEVLLVPPFLRSLVPVVATSLIITGMLIGGILVNRVGRKRFAVISGLIAGLFTFVGYPITIPLPNVWVLLSFRFTAAFVGGMSFVAGPVLLLDQVPKYRGIVMSLSSALGGIGLAMFFLVGGVMLSSIGNPPIGYPVAMITLGVIGMAHSLVVLFFAKDPIKIDLTQKRGDPSEEQP